MHGCLVPMIPRLTLGGPEGEPHGETATSAMTGEATFSCILCFYKYFSTVGFRTSGFRYNIGPYLGYVIRVFRKIAYIQKFREKNSPVSCMQPAGGHHCAKNLC
eukprot:SAG11_NODE_529_length_8721_cov_24.489330_6_plen_104_part_00